MQMVEMIRVGTNGTRHCGLPCGPVRQVDCIGVGVMTMSIQNRQDP